MPTVLSSADEIAVKAFLDGKISFTQVPTVIDNVMNEHETNLDPTINDILSTIEWSKSKASEVFGIQIQQSK